MGARHDRPARVLVIGGGISGLAAAHTLATSPDPPQITLVEADERLGGTILTTPFAGLPAVDAGPDAFLARVPEGLALAGAVGIGAGDITSPATGAAMVWWDGRMHRLPDGLVLGAPAGLVGLARSRLLTWHGKLRAAMEPLAPRHDIDDDDLGRLIRSRFGPEVLERLVGPLVGGINAGDPARMSTATVAPQLAAALRTHRSLLLGLRSTRRAATAGPVFIAPTAGMGALVEHLATALRSAGVDIRTAAAASPLEPAGRGWRSGEHEAEAVVVATPAAAAAHLLSGVAPDVARDLRSFEAASVAMVTLAFDATGVPPPSGSGYLVPRAAQRTISACSWASTKWAHWRRPGQLVVRASAGRMGAEEAVHLDDDALLAGVLADLRDQAGIRATPTAVRITRWPRSMPQYPPHHLDRVDDVEERLAHAAPGVVLAGAAYRGVGIPSCIRQAHRAVARAEARATAGH
jgi:protoporphyrinogen/coproporphyrinogen III oxidase